jgi:chromosomal replication initiator protein
MTQPETTAPSGLWESIVASVEAKIGQRACRTWVSPVRIKGLDAGVLTLSVPNEFFVDWLSEHYAAPLTEAACSAVGRPVKIDFCVEPRAAECSIPAGNADPGNDNAGSGDEENHSPAIVAAQPVSRPRYETSSLPRHTYASLNSNYTFDNFVVGGNNELAAAACRAVSERPGNAYNPLFIYGGSGLGKTHMLHAIGHAALRGQHGDGVCYLSAERFMNEMIASIQQGTALAFRNKYRRARLLLIDDVHFLGGKESTQEEFFHTFNSLHEAGHQIVLTSDRSPKEIPRVEERLISRFTWGLVADIQRPDLETRVAILQKKAAKQGMKLSPEVGLAIAQMASGNIRELEGSLLRVKAHAQLAGQPLTPEVVAQVLDDILCPHKKSATVNDVQQLVARHYGLRPQDLCGRKRTNSVAFPRQVAMYLCRVNLDVPLAVIGEKFGGRDHTTVLYACSKIETQLKTDHYLRKTIRTLSERVAGNVENVFMN